MENNFYRTTSNLIEAWLKEKYLKSNAGKLWLKKFFKMNGGKTGFPACVTQSGGDSRTGYKKRLSLKPHVRQ